MFFLPFWPKQVVLLNLVLLQELQIAYCPVLRKSEDLAICCWAGLHCDVLVVWNMNFITFHSVGKNHPNWLSYFSEGLKPPRSCDVFNPLIHLEQLYHHEIVHRISWELVKWWSMAWFILDPIKITLYAATISWDIAESVILFVFPIGYSTVTPASTWLCQNDHRNSGFTQL